VCGVRAVVRVVAPADFRSVTDDRPAGSVSDADRAIPDRLPVSDTTDGRDFFSV